MEKIYIMEIRDLTNEARELNAQTFKVNTFEAEAKKEIEVMAENHIFAIASYLNHQLSEVEKFTKSFYASYESFGSRIYIRIRKRNGETIFVLGIQPDYCSDLQEFIIGKDNSIKSEYHKSLSNCSEHIEVLLRCWKFFKNALQEAISKKLVSIQEENVKKQETLESKLSLYENFEL